MSFESNEVSMSSTAEASISQRPKKEEDLLVKDVVLKAHKIIRNSKNDQRSLREHGEDKITLLKFHRLHSIFVFEFCERGFSLKTSSD
jgi:hypothetical protein